MAISSNSKRIQLTFNRNKEKERVVLDYLSQSFSETQEIKRILFEYIVNQNTTKRVEKTRSKKKSIKSNNSDKKLLTITNSDIKAMKDNNNDAKIGTVTKNDVKIGKDSESKSHTVKNNDNNFALDLSNFNDKPVKVKSDNKDGELERIKQNELDELNKFI